jgi:predicted phage terminase large subunit-like protein
VQSWDTAFKKNEENDYSVCTTWKVADNGYYLIDLWRGRVEFPELKRKAIELNERFRPNEILIEDKASGQSLIQELLRETRLPIKPIKVSTDKISRVHAITPLIEAGKVFLIQDARSEMLEAVLSECEDFPNGEFDDVVDSISQFLNNEKEKYEPNLNSIIHLPRKIFNTNRYKGFRSRKSNLLSRSN